MILHQAEYLRWIKQRGVGAKDRVGNSLDTYVSYLDSVSTLIGHDISPSVLSSGADVANIASSLQGKREPKTIDNYSSAMRQYVAMVAAEAHLLKKRQSTATPDDSFTARALQIYEDAKTQIHYVASRFRQKIMRDGGLAAAKHWLRPSKTTQGFQRLLDHDRLDLSVEAVALDPRWSALFTATELATARERLTQFGYFSRPEPSPNISSQISADELPDETQFPEGAKKTITVSAYERNTAARDKCIAHYKARCYVCDFDFGKVYGELGEGYIHVHHLTPFAETTGPRLTDPITDLRPVCPNCHSMLHRRNPPTPIAKLKEIIGKHTGRVNNRSVSSRKSE